MRENYLSIERPDTKATIEFLSFHPEGGVKVEGVTVKLELTYKDGKAQLYVYAIDAGSAEILFDSVREVSSETLDADVIDAEIE